MKKPTICAQCDDTGWKTVPHPGKARVVTRCECELRKRKEHLLKRANIPERYTGGFAGYRTDFHGSNQSLETAKMFAMQLVQEYPLTRVGLLFVGPLGIGKTHLACAVLRELIEAKGAAGLFYSYADLLTNIRDTYNDNGSNKYVTDNEGNRWETESQILNHVVNVDVLLLDEVGKVKASDWVLDKIREIIGGRYNKQRTTIVTTNFPLTATRAGSAMPVLLQDKIGADMVSRLREMCRLVPMDGADYRQNQNAVNFPDNGR
jgi:DNA replication protein DnaC